MIMIMISGAPRLAANRNEHEQSIGDPTFKKVRVHYVASFPHRATILGV